MNELLTCIDQIDQSQEEAEINVLESLIQSYDKALMILECYDGDDFSAFEIFQEGEKWDKFKEDTKAPILGNKGESLIKRILMIIPRLVQKLAMLVRKIFTKNKKTDQQIKSEIDNLQTQGQQVVNVPEGSEAQLTPQSQQEPVSDTITTKSNEIEQPTQNNQSAEQIPRQTDKKQLKDCDITIKGALIFFKTESDSDKTISTIMNISGNSTGIPKISPDDLSFRSLHHVKQYLDQLDKYNERIDQKIEYFKNIESDHNTLKINYGEAVDKLEKLHELYKKAKANLIDSQLVHINEICKKTNEQLSQLKQMNSLGPDRAEGDVMDAFGHAFGIPADALISEGPEFISAIEQYLSKLNTYSMKLNSYTVVLNQIWSDHIAAIREAINVFGIQDTSKYSKNGIDISINR